jgi:uncharacterized protein
LVRVGKVQIDPAALAVTLLLGTAGGLMAQALHLPLGLLLGSLAVTGAVAARDGRVLGQPVHLPQPFRMTFVPVIGVAIGGAFTPEVVGQALDWGPSLLALCLYLPLAHWIGFRVYQRGGFDRRTAFWGSVPGGLIESVTLGEAAGADMRMLVVMQFLRLILTIVVVPLAFWGLTGHAVGSASGARMAGSGVHLGVRDVAVLVGAGLAGALAGRALRLPGWVITGPLLASALAHGFGLTRGVPPGWMVGAVQVIVGAGLGARFAGLPKGVLGRAAGLAALNAALMMALALGFAAALHGLVDEPLAAVFLAYAPGGLAEMSLIALSLHMSVVYVTLHHVARIVLAVTFARVGGQWV